MIEEWLETTAVFALLFFILCFINLIVIYFTKPIGLWLKRVFTRFHPIYLHLAKLTAKAHIPLGILAIILMLVHGYFGFLYRHSFPLSGVLIAVTWGLLALFGLGKTFIWKKAGRWSLIMHTIIAVLAVAALIYHYIMLAD
jgi:hypothetical protein